MCLVARHLEAHGIPTLCLGSALDILRAGRAPRASFVDYPLGHSAGKPNDRTDQRAIVRRALAGFESLHEAGGILVQPVQWDADGDWRAAAGASSGDDTRQPRDDTPQFQSPADRVAALASGSLVVND